MRGDFAADRRLILLSLIAVPIGVICSFVALGLTKLISLFTNIFYFQTFSFAPHSPSESSLGIWSIAIPVIGSLIIGLMAKFGSEKIRGHGIPEALEVILFGRSIMQIKVAILKPISSAISIGSGGPFGAEGPIIMTGGAFGSIIAQTFSLSAAERKTLLVAGAAAGMAAIFSTPIAAVFLAVELLLFELRPRSLVPVAIASVIAATMRPYLLGDGPLFPVTAHGALSPEVLLAALPLGMIAGVFSAIVSKSLYKLEDLFSELPIHWMWWPALGGLVVGIGGYFKPQVLGVGYDLIGNFLQGDVAQSDAGSLLVMKGLVWVFALASGTSGGVLAPLLIMGCALGSISSHFLPVAAVGVWPMLAMAAVMGGMMHAPLTAVIFALELTHDIHALPGLLVAAIGSYAVTVFVMKRSILTEKIARRGFDIFREYAVDPLERLRVEEAMTKDVKTIHFEETLSEITKKYFGSSDKHRGFPIVSTHNELLGMMTSADLLRASADKKIAKDLITRSPVTIHSGQSCTKAAEKMAEQDVGRLVVVHPSKPTTIIGIITRSDLLKARHRAVNEELHQEKILLHGRKTPKT